MEEQLIEKKKPTKKSFGVFNTLVKSSIFKPKPKPNIINASIIGAIFVTISMIFLRNSITVTIYLRFMKLQSNLKFLLRTLLFP